MVIVLVRTTLRADADVAAYDALGARMFEIVSAMPGFLGAQDLVSAEGAKVSVIRFASLEALRAWREEPEHLVAQARGKAEFYASYEVEVCEVVRSYAGPR